MSSARDIANKVGHEVVITKSCGRVITVSPGVVQDSFDFTDVEEDEG